MKTQLLKNHKMNILYILFILLFTSSGLFAQKRSIHNEILVYILEDSLELPTDKQQVESFAEIQFSSKRLQNTFRTLPLESITRTFQKVETSERTLQNEDGILIKKPAWDRVFTIQLSDEKAVKEALERLSKEPGILFAEPHSNMRLHTDPLYPQQWHLNNTGQSFGTPDADIDAPEAWQIYTGSSSVKLAIIDSGVENNHNDLS
jgi:hypothetical protein